MKRVDILVTIVICYTDIASDCRAKLLLCTVQSGVFLAIHARGMPYDDRQGLLLGRLEFNGLVSRFVSFTLAVMLFVFAPSWKVSVAL